MIIVLKMTHRALPFLPSILKWGVMPVILTQNQCAENAGVNLPALWDRASMIKSQKLGATTPRERSLESQDSKLPQILLNPSELPSTGGLTVSAFSLHLGELMSSHSFRQPRLSLGSQASLLTPSLYSFHQIPSLCLLNTRST